jgi:Pyruvate/2-oxoacid:ferredoxin oxidoreductase gamma subunit
MAMHHEFWPDVRDRLIPASIVVIDRSVFNGPLDLTDGIVVEIEASAVATEMGNSRGGAMVALGALGAATGLVDLPRLEAAAYEVLPPYRAEHAKANAAALAAGFALVPDPVPSLWSSSSALSR